MKKIRNMLVNARQLFKDSLFRNATFLVASTFIMSILGFGFWLFVAHLYTPSEIGIASALIAISTLISNFSLLGLNSGLIRFLPKAKNQSRDINAAILLVGGVTMLAATAYILLAGSIGAKVSFLASDSHKLMFIILMATVSLNSLTDAVFIANRRAELHTAAYAVLGVVKLILPLFLIPLGALGIFAAYVVAMIISLLFSIFLMRRWCGYRFLSSPNWSAIKKTRHYTRNNYLGVIFAGIASQTLPIQIVHRLGSAEAAYFSMAWMMANLLYVIPSATTQSLLAESSFNPAQKIRHIRHAIKLLTLILVPTVTLAIVVAPYLLRLFGSQYSSGSTALFQILAVSTFFLAACTVGSTLMNIEQRTKGIVIVQFIIATVTLGLAQFTIHLGLSGVGLALLGGNVAGTIAILVLLGVLRRPSYLPAARRGGLPTPNVIQEFLEMYNLKTAQVGTDIGGGDRSSTVIVSQGNQKYVLKVRSARKQSLQDLQEELKFTNFLDSRGIPVPHLIANTSNEVISVVNSDNEEWLGILMDLEPGFSPSTYPSDLLIRMAHMQANIHNLGIEYANTHGATLSIRKKATRKSVLLPLVPKGLSHFDFYAGNLLTDGHSIVCVLDFEGMRYDRIAICTYYTLGCIYSSSQRLADLHTYIKAYEAVRKMNWLEKKVIQFAVYIRYSRPKLALSMLKS